MAGDAFVCWRALCLKPQGNAPALKVDFNGGFGFGEALADFERIGARRSH
jgi:hypothetical protein